MDSFSKGTGPREMHEATCKDCGKQCKVPFKPNGARPVYCSDCYQKHKPARTSRCLRAKTPGAEPRILALHDSI